MAITLTESAAQHVRGYLQRHGGGVGLRLGVKRTGCSGWGYLVAVAEEVESGDCVFEDQDISVVVDQQALELIDGTEIDFVTQGLNRTFVFNNPNVKQQCGCGESFTVA